MILECRLVPRPQRVTGIVRRHLAAFLLGALCRAALCGALDRLLLLAEAIRFIFGRLTADDLGATLCQAALQRSRCGARVFLGRPTPTRLVKI